MNEWWFVYANIPKIHSIGYGFFKMFEYTITKKLPACQVTWLNCHFILLNLLSIYSILFVSSPYSFEMNTVKQVVLNQMF